jgi:hypothetical protein
MFIKELCLVLVNIYQIIFAIIGSYYGFMAIWVNYEQNLTKMKKFLLISRFLLPTMYFLLSIEWLYARADFMVEEVSLCGWNIFELYVLIYFILISRKVYKSGFYGKNI